MVTFKFPPKLVSLVTARPPDTWRAPDETSVEFVVSDIITEPFPYTILFPDVTHCEDVPPPETNRFPF